MRRYIAVSCSVLLAGCASSGPTGSEIMTGSVKPDTARLVIYRDVVMGFAVQPSYMIDGKAVAAAQPQGFVVCSLKPGKHVISVDNTALTVNLGGGSDKFSLDMKPGTTSYIRARPSVGLTIGVITLSSVTEEQGRNDVYSLHKIDGDCAA